MKQLKIYLTVLKDFQLTRAQANVEMSFSMKFILFFTVVVLVAGQDESKYKKSSTIRYPLEILFN